MDEILIQHKKDEEAWMTEPEDFVTSSNDDAELRGLILFYINVGQLPPQKAEKLTLRWKEKTERAFRKLPERYKIIWIPTRETHTRVEFFQLP